MQDQTGPIWRRSPVPLPWGQSKEQDLRWVLPLLFLPLGCYKNAEMAPVPLPTIRMSIILPEGWEIITLSPHFIQGPFLFFSLDLEVNGKQKESHLGFWSHSVSSCFSKRLAASRKKNLLFISTTEMSKISFLAAECNIAAATRSPGA